MVLELKERLFTNKESSKLNFIINTLIFLMLIFLVLEILFTISYSGVYVIGPSMNNTLKGAQEYLDSTNKYYVADTTGDYVYVKKNAQPDYGDIVVVKKDVQTTIIKRVIAIGGDYVKIENGKVYIKHSAEEPFPEEPIKEEYVDPRNNSPTNANNTFYNDETGYYVEAGCYFLLGDNRNVSLDSRENNGISFSEKQILGVVADWSLNGKNFFTRLHKFFSFDLPDCFGIDNRIKRLKSSDSEV